MTLDTTKAVETGRTWRDLPPSPPVGDPLAPVPAPVAPSPPPSGTIEPPPRRRRRLPWALGTLAVLVVVALLLLWAPWNRGDETAAPSTTTSTTRLQAAPPPTLPQTDEPIADVAEALLPSVVQIDLPDGVGSGFVYDESGLVLTAAHVVEGYRQVDVRLADGREVSGTVLGADTTTDIAVVQIEASDLVAAPLALDGDVTVGQTAIAVGSPFGFSQTVTAGVVSALDQELDVGRRVIRGLIQTDAPINPGNSGGPLADRYGRVIGVNVAIVSPSGGNDGLGFAVPITTAIRIAERFTGSTPDGTPVPELVPSDPGTALPDDLQQFFDQFGLDPFDLPFAFDFNDPLGSLPDDLRRNFEEFFQGDPFDSLVGPRVTPTVLPDGYTVASTSVTIENGHEIDTVVLAGPDGPVVITVWGEQRSIPSGEKVDIGGVTGSLRATGDTLVVTWIEAGKTIEIRGPASLSRNALIATAEGLEVQP